MESPSHLRDHPEPLMLTLLAALLHTRLREITDTLVELLISTVHRIGARADKKVTEELVNAFKRVTGKENILAAVAVVAGVLQGRLQERAKAQDRQQQLLAQVALNEGGRGASELFIYNSCRGTQTGRGLPR